MAIARNNGILLELTIDEAMALSDLLGAGVSAWTLEQMELKEVLTELRKVAPHKSPTFREIAVLEGSYFEG